MLDDNQPFTFSGNARRCGQLNPPAQIFRAGERCTADRLESWGTIDPEQRVA
jgi:hypothetical protein